MGSYTFFVYFRIGNVQGENRDRGGQVGEDKFNDSKGNAHQLSPKNINQSGSATACPTDSHCQKQLLKTPTTKNIEILPKPLLRVPLQGGAIMYQNIQKNSGSLLKPGESSPIVIIAPAAVENKGRKPQRVGFRSIAPSPAPPEKTIPYTTVHLTQNGVRVSHENLPPTKNADTQTEEVGIIENVSSGVQVGSNQEFRQTIGTQAALPRIGSAIWRKHSVAETQTAGDYILQKAMRSANIPTHRESRASQVSPRAKVKKSSRVVSTNSSQTQTTPGTKGLPKRRHRRVSRKRGLFGEEIQSPPATSSSTNTDDFSDNLLAGLTDMETQTQTIALLEQLAESISTQTLESFLGETSGGQNLMVGTQSTETQTHRQGPSTNLQQPLSIEIDSLVVPDFRNTGTGTSTVSNPTTGNLGTQSTSMSVGTSVSPDSSIFNSGLRISQSTMVDADFFNNEMNIVPPTNTYREMHTMSVGTSVSPGASIFTAMDVGTSPSIVGRSRTTRPPSSYTSTEMHSISVGTSLSPISNMFFQSEMDRATQENIQNNSISSRMTSTSGIRSMSVGTSVSPNDNIFNQPSQTAIINTDLPNMRNFSATRTTGMQSVGTSVSPSARILNDVSFGVGESIVVGSGFQNGRNCQVSHANTTRQSISVGTSVSPNARILNDVNFGIGESIGVGSGFPNSRNCQITHANTNRQSISVGTDASLDSNLISNVSLGVGETMVLSSGIQNGRNGQVPHANPTRQSISVGTNASSDSNIINNVSLGAGETMVLSSGFQNGRNGQVSRADTSRQSISVGTDASSNSNIINNVSLGDGDTMVLSSGFQNGRTNNFSQSNPVMPSVSVGASASPYSSSYGHFGEGPSTMVDGSTDMHQDINSASLNQVSHSLRVQNGHACNVGTVFGSSLSVGGVRTAPIEASRVAGTTNIMDRLLLDTLHCDQPVTPPRRTMDQSTVQTPMSVQTDPSLAGVRDPPISNANTQTTTELELASFLDSSVQTVDDPDCNDIETQTMDDMFNQFLSNMETQTGDNLIFPDLEFANIQTQTMFDPIADSSSQHQSATVQTQTPRNSTMSSQTANNVQSIDTETQTFLDELDFSSNTYSLTDSHTQTTWKDLESWASGFNDN